MHIIIILYTNVDFWRICGKMEINISRQSDWSNFEKVFAKDGEYDSEFNLPRRWNGKDFYSDLHGVLDKYIKKLETNVGENDSLVKKTKNARDRVLEIVRIYLHGYPAEAYNCMTNLMNMLDDYPMYTDRSSGNVGSLYRMTKVNENINDKAWVFHAPYDIRTKIRTYRYSIAGYPSLYLADSLELCEQEVKYFEKKEKAIVSKYIFDEDFNESIKILDFGFRPQDLACPENEEGKAGEMTSNELNASKRKLFEESIEDARRWSRRQRRARSVKNGEPDAESMQPSKRYILWYPLIAACAYVRVNRDDAFAPEYIVPQLITQYLRNQRSEDFVGIRYFSCYSEKASEIGMNYVFPTSGDPLILKSGVKQFCPVLNEAFSFTEPEYIPEYKSLEELGVKLDRKKPSRVFELTRDDYQNETKVELPNGLMYVAAASFYRCKNLEKVGLPEGLKEIGGRAFYGCTGITELKLSKGIETIGDKAFLGCKGITDLMLPDGLKEIGNYAFAFCTGITNLKLSDGIKEIGDYAFHGCSGITDLKLPDGLKEIGNLAFSNCTRITELKLPSGLEEIGDLAFSDCTGITELKLPDKLETIGALAFSGCTGITELKLPSGLKEIGIRVFAGCTGITELKLPDGLEIIGWSAFAGCTGITELKLPDGLETIGAWAFAGCTGIKSIEYGGTMEQWKKVKLWRDTGIEGHIIICTDGEILPNPENPSDEKSA